MAEKMDRRRLLKAAGSAAVVAVVTVAGRPMPVSAATSRSSASAAKSEVSLSSALKAAVEAAIKTTKEWKVVQAKIESAKGKTPTAEAVSEYRRSQYELWKGIEHELEEITATKLVGMSSYAPSNQVVGILKDCVRRFPSTQAAKKASDLIKRYSSRGAR